jgi:hypothetical protein
MRRVHNAVGAAVLMACALVAGEAKAVSLTGTLAREEGGNCALKHAEVLKWTPADGPPASFIADAFLDHGGSLWMALGYDESGFWSAEGYWNDASDEGGGLVLVHTSFSGKRRSSPVAAYDLAQKHPDRAELRKAIKARLFTLAAGTWNVEKLSHDYKLKLPKHDAEGRIETFTGWMAEVSRPGGFVLRFAPTASTFMCWCDYSWTGYALAKPKK